MKSCVLVKGVTIALVACGLAASTALAQQVKSAEKSSPCKGLEQKTCTAKDECSWVAATKRKDGREVKAYCRLKPNKSAAAPTTSKK